MNEAVDILLIDDEPRNLLVLDAALDSPSYRLLHATNADEAMKQLLDHDVAVIVLDVLMPETDGYTLAKIIRGSKRFRRVPIVFLTAQTPDNRSILEAYEAGAVDYLSKPFHTHVLRQKIAIFVELFVNRREIDALNRDLEHRVHQRTEQLARSEAQLREVDAQRTAFLATLAHELRNPLAPLRTGLDLLRSPHGPDDGKAAIEAMTRQLGYLVRLVDDLLDASRATTGLLRLQSHPRSLSAIVEGAAAIARPHLDRRRPTLVVDGDIGGLWDVDETRIVQIISNLLHNASKFSADAGTIRVELLTDSTGATINVRDHGTGIPADEIDKVFELFTTIARSSEGPTGGLGIGLTLSRRLAELHRGTLTASSEGKGKGATFALWLPAELSSDSHGRTHESSTREEATHAVKTPISQPPQPLTIVIIEDNQDAAELLARWLIAAGHEVHVAHEGAEGIDLVQRTAPDLVLCDIGLPGMNGSDVCRRVKGQIAQAPVMIALTGWGTPRDRASTLKAGFDHHLVKPVDPAELRVLLSGIARRDAAG